jgi:RNA recognition motif-containing protein
MRLHVGNLPFGIVPEDLRSAFEVFGAVYDVSLIGDRATGRPSGFGFVEMEAAAAATAIEQLNGKVFRGRVITVGEARERVGGAARS